jgi:hypothetical protein
LIRHLPVEISSPNRAQPFWADVCGRFDGNFMLASGDSPVPTSGAAPGANVPIAGPSNLSPAARVRRVPIRATFRRRWTPEALKGWAGSVTLHVIVLLALGCCYLAPRVLTPIAIETGLVDIPAGESHDEMLAGGSNALLPTPREETEAIGPALELPAHLDITSRQFAGISRQPRSSDQSSKSAGNAPRKPGNGPRRKGNSRAGAGGPAPGGGFGTPRFGSGRERINGVSVKVGDPQFTLMWNTEGVDIDLHVIEPRGDEIFFAHPNGKQGGELDVDNTWAYGPENIYWLVNLDGSGPTKSKASARTKAKGPGPPGAYKWYVVYYDVDEDLDEIPPTYWQVRVKHDGEVHVFDGWLYEPGECSAVFAVKVHPPKEPTQDAKAEVLKHPERNDPAGPGTPPNR